MEEHYVPRFQVNLFGSFRLLGKNALEITLKNRKSKAILAILLASKDQRETRPKMWSLLWSRSPQEQASTSFRSALSVLRKSLNVDGFDVLESRETDVLINKRYVRTDLDRLLTPSSPGEEELNSVNFSSEMYNDLDGLDPMFDEWLYYTRLEIKNRLSDRIAKLVVSLPLDRPDAIELICNNLLSLDPYNEAAIKTIIASRIQQDRTASATEMLKRYERRLAQDLGIECPANIRALFDQIRAASQRKGALSAAYGINVPLRAAAAKRLASMADRASLLNGKAVLVTGSAGIGKTHLIDNFVAQLASQDCISVKYDRTVLATSGPDELVRRLCHDLIEQNENVRNPMSALLGSPMKVSGDYSVTMAIPKGGLKIERRNIRIPSGDYQSDMLLFQVSEYRKTVILLDDFDSFNAFHVPALFEWFSTVKDAAVLLVISSRKELELAQDFFDDHISLEPLELGEIRALIEQRFSGEVVSETYVQTMNELTRGIPLLINQLLDTDTRPGGPKSLDRPDARDLIRAGRYPGYEATVFRLFFQSSKAARLVAVRVAILGGAIARKRYEDLFGRLDEAVLNEMAAVNLIRGDRARRDKIELFHVTTSDVVISTIDFDEIQESILPVEIATLLQPEKINIGTYIVNNCGTKKYEPWIYPFIDTLEQSEKFELLGRFFESAMGQEGLQSDRRVRLTMLNSLLHQARFQSIAKLRAVHGLDAGRDHRLIFDFASAVTGEIGRNPSQFAESPYGFMGYFFSGDFAGLFASVKAEVEAAIATIERDQMPPNLERVVHLLGYYAMGNAQLGNFQEARSLANTAAGIAKQSSNTAIGMFSEFYRQYVLTHQGELNNAIHNLIRVLRNGRHHSRSLETGLLVCHLGFIYQIVGKIDLSIQVSERIYRELPANETGILQAYLETSLTSAYTLSGDLSRAKTFARRSLETAEAGGFRSVMVWSLRNQGILAQLHSMTGLSPTIEDAYELATELDMQPDLAHLLRIRSGLERMKGNTSAASRLLDQAHVLYAKMGMNRWLDYHPESQFGH
ncbi:hypothetical protein DPM33_04990 [Mesorhizobium hawassense]|uniref:Bacterial transcriptional activator domain-containing protein n=1 Tax=Mesorhizobium hawassense TaxID=1209954 RepID=A0A330I4D5_9HYPH|nr:AAA family ATPase [Mesorhizobium hawassense]RAZ91837.1 hypothetical protein DPM33_04990 [Mesorhizobium hawassense]